MISHCPAQLQSSKTMANAHLNPWSDLTAELEQTYHIRLRDGAQSWIPSPRIALPVRVLRQIGRGEGDGVVVGIRVLRAGRRVAELGVQRHAGRAAGVDSEEAVDAGVEAGGLDGVFLFAMEETRLACGPRRRFIVYLELWERGNLDLRDEGRCWWAGLRRGRPTLKAAAAFWEAIMTPSAQ